MATIAAEIGMDTTTIVAALLHDTVEDTDYSLEDLTRDFGPEVARLVDGVTKLDKVAMVSASADAACASASSEKHVASVWRATMRSTSMPASPSCPTTSSMLPNAGCPASG